MSSTASAVSSSHPGSGDPTPASTWLALGGCQITDQVVVLPESVVDEGDSDALEAVLDHHGVTMLMTGVRQPAPQPGRLPGNWVHIGVSPILEKRAPATGSTRQRWFHVRQNKHHRWSLNESQIFQYHLGGALHPHILWWEAMDVARRTVQFVELGEELTLVCLVCEDLAQHDDVAESRSVRWPNAGFHPLARRTTVDVALGGQVCQRAGRRPWLGRRDAVRLRHGAAMPTPRATLPRRWSVCGKTPSGGSGRFRWRMAPTASC